MIKLIAFLGNVGTEYENTRHNVAWLFADSLNCANKLSWQKKFRGVYASTDRNIILSDTTNANILQEKIYFLKPETYMNASGESVAALATFFKIKPNEILVVHDELELAPGTISLKWSGGLGGHNGLRSIKSALGTPDFWRLRFGIGRPNHPDVAGYVLSRFCQDELITLSLAFQKAQELFDLLISTDKCDKLLANWSKVKID